MLLADFGALYAMGSNEYGQLGVGRGDHQLLCKPTLVESSCKFDDVQCGGFHNLGISNRNSLFSWGRGEEGQLGLGDYNQRLTPTQVEDVEVREISSGLLHSFVLTVQNKLISFGSNSRGQLGISIEIKQECNPTTVPFTSNSFIKEIFCGDENTSIMMMDGEVFVTGDNSNNQLLIVDGPDFIDYFILLPFSKKLKFAAFGFTSMLLTSENELIVWGISPENCLTSKLNVEIKSAVLKGNKGKDLELIDSLLA